MQTCACSGYQMTTTGPELQRWCCGGGGGGDLVPPDVEARSPSNRAQPHMTLFAAGAMFSPPSLVRHVRGVMGTSAGHVASSW